MNSKHVIYFEDSKKMSPVKDESVELMVTSPPYPMIEMWDEAFSEQNPRIKKALDENDGNLAFELMNIELNKVWKEVYRVLIPGGIACVNIGDATRTIGNIFKLYPSHVKISNNFLDLGFQALPGIIWRKPTNAPNKFMGSGMLPPGAYITLEHEHILIFRKGDKRLFKNDENKQIRRESSYFWEERNQWFSDIWEIRGENQKIINDGNNNRIRSAAFPIELVFRLINMFSTIGDTVLDPFLGTGTTTLAAMSVCRNSIGYEIDETLGPVIEEKLNSVRTIGNQYIDERLSLHNKFISKREKSKEIKYINQFYNFPVVTSQEQHLKFNSPKKISRINDFEFLITYNIDKVDSADKKRNIVDWM